MFILNKISESESESPDNYHTLNLVPLFELQSYIIN